jgi:hypothetical protein
MLLAALGAYDILSRPRYGDRASVNLERDPVAAILAVDAFGLHLLPPGGSVRLFCPGAALIMPDDLKRRGNAAHWPPL